MATKKENNEISKEVKEKKTTSKGKTNNTKQENTFKKELSINDIPPELMNQMFKMFQEMQNENKLNESENDKSIEKPKKITKSYLRTIKDKEIVVRSIVGVVSFKSPKTNTLYKWTGIGDEEVLTIDEILTMDSKSRRFLNTPWLVIDDKDVIEGLGLTDLYKIIEKIENVDGLLEMNFDEIENTIKKAPYEYQRTLSSVIFNKINNNEIRDIMLIRKLEEILGTTLLL